MQDVRDVIQDTITPLLHVPDDIVPPAQDLHLNAAQDTTIHQLHSQLQQMQQMMLQMQTVMMANGGGGGRRRNRRNNNNNNNNSTSNNQQNNNANNNTTNNANNNNGQQHAWNVPLPQSGGNSSSNNGPPQGPPPHYCWTHGACYHTSANCHNPAQGHQANATLQNRMNGNNRNCFSS
jgi:hypothetical protein